MLWSGIKKLGNELQLKRTDSAVVGMVKNCFVRLYDGINRKILELLVPEINESNKQYITEKLKVFKVKEHEWMECGVRILFLEYVRPYSISKIKNILLDLTDYFAAEYPNQQPHCEKCGVSKKLNAYCVDNRTWITCDDCRELFENEVKNTNAENEYVSTNYLSGFIGSLIFSIPGILLTVLLFFLETLAAVSSVLYVFLGIKGYKIFKGKTSRFGVFLIMLSTFIMIVLGIIVSYSVLIIKEMKTIDIDMLLYFLALPEIQQEMIRNILLSFVISGIYLGFQFIQMMKDWKSEKEIKYAREI